MKRSWRASGVGEEAGNAENRGNNGAFTSPDDRSRDRDAKKVPRSQSFGALSSHGSNGHADGGYQQSGTELTHNSIGSHVTNSAARPVSGGNTSPQTQNKSTNSILAGMTDQQRFNAIQEVLPAVSRKVTACAACRKQKIKCIMENDEPPCQRCTQRGLSCVLNRSLQSLVNDTRKIQSLQGDIHHMHAVLSEVCQAINIKLPPPLTVPYTEAPSNNDAAKSDNITSHQDDEDVVDASPPMSPSDMKGPIDTFLEPEKSVGTPVSAAVASPLASVHSKKSGQPPDIISKGIVSLGVADRLVSRYCDRLDHYLYGIGSVFNDLKSLRKLSPSLLAAVCAVSALHDDADTKVFEACQTEFLKLVSQSMFEKRGVEFLRALCIGSYWMSDASRILSSDALRRSSDVRLQKYFYQVTVPDSTNYHPQGSLPPAEMVDRVRLWYLFYISDQHLSILYNRDPIVHADQDIILGWEAFLESGYTDESDVRIASQVNLLQMMSHIRSSCGPESVEPLSKALATSLNNFNRQIDQWFARFSSSFIKAAIHGKIGSFPHKGLNLHYHFAKLYLGHHVFRGLKNDPVPGHFLASALMAHGAAVYIFEMIINDTGLQESLLGIPFYFHVMISFAGHFLMSCGQHWEQLSIDVDENLNLINRAIEIFKRIACLEQHPLHKMRLALEHKYLESRAIIDRPATIPYDLNNPAPNDSNLQASVAQWDGITRMNSIGGHMQPNINMNGQNLMNPMDGSLPSAYAMITPQASSAFDMNYNDLDGFNFPDLDFTH